MEGAWVAAGISLGPRADFSFVIIERGFSLLQTLIPSSWLKDTPRIASLFPVHVWAYALVCQIRMGLCCSNVLMLYAANNEVKAVTIEKY